MAKTRQTLAFNKKGLFGWILLVGYYSEIQYRLYNTDKQIPNDTLIIAAVVVFRSYYPHLTTDTISLISLHCVYYRYININIITIYGCKF